MVGINTRSCRTFECHRHQGDPTEWVKTRCARFLPLDHFPTGRRMVRNTSPGLLVVVESSIGQQTQPLPQGVVQGGGGGDTVASYFVGLAK